jgi:hypothetical protein
MHYYVMKFYARSAEAGLLFAFGIMAFYGLRTIGIITINHRWGDFRRL